jgi:hypothetical protein
MATSAPQLDLDPPAEQKSVLIGGLDYCATEKPIPDPHTYCAPLTAAPSRSARRRDSAAILGDVGMALAARHAPFRVRWIQLPLEGIPVAVTTYSRYHPGGAMVAVAGI